MNPKMLLSLLLVSFVNFQLFAQEDKPPVAENDFASARAFETIEIRVLDNDFSFNGHPFKLFLVYAAAHGEFVKNDSTIFYTPDPTYRGLDSLKYKIKDLENNLLSDFAKVYITIQNEGFDTLDANAVSCRINSYGLQFWDGQSQIYEVPAGSGKGTIFNEAFWIGGYDENESLCVAAERYRQVGTDFFQGPVMDSSAYSNELDISWNKVWKLSSEEVAYHRQHWQDEGYEPVDNISGWPGNGDTELGQASQLAPYYDWDGDDVYNPMAGDFPLIKGNKAVYTIVNDHRSLHTESLGKRLGVEIHTLYYAFDEPADSALNYTIFADQRIMNRSSHSYHDVYAGNFLDFDLGYASDDFLCCDTALRSAIVYNGVAIDGNGGSGDYGEHPPAQSFTCLNYEMDGFMYFDNYGSIPQMQDPQYAVDYYNYLRSLWKDASHLTYGGNGYGGTDSVMHVFTGDPVSGVGWTEQSVGNTPGDRRGLISSGPYDFLSGDTLHLEYALVFARDFEGDNLSSVALLKTRIQAVRDIYKNLLGVEDARMFSPDLKLYPNPCKGELFIDVSKSNTNAHFDFAVFDILGENIINGSIRAGIINEIDFGNVKPGIYLIRFNDGKNVFTRKVIRERP